MNILCDGSRLFVTTGENLIVYNSESGEDHLVKVPVPELPSNLTKGQLDVLNKEERTINSVAVSRDTRKIAVSTENKQVVVFDTSLNIIKNFILSRTASKLIFSNTGDIIVADKTGDVYLYRFDDEQNESVLLLGHLSMILDIVLSSCGKYLITCDRDEKIRVSRFPNTYNIQSYCLGHREFVSFIKLLDGDHNVLVSASGDGTVRFWNYLKGEQLGIINANEHVKDSSLIERFSKEMDVEKVDVQALPVTQMQVFIASSCLFVAVSLYSFRGIQLYKSDLENFCNVTFLKCIEPFDESPCNFCLSNQLYVFDNNKLHLYNFVDGDYILDTCDKLQLFFEKYKKSFKFLNKNAITVLYKRKFDNVQEYLERKKLRLESLIK